MNKLTTFILCQLLLGWLILATVAQPLTSRTTMANSYLERGNAWFAKSAYEQAEADFDLAIASDSGSAGAYYNRAITRFRVGKLAV